MFIRPIALKILPALLDTLIYNCFNKDLLFIKWENIEIDVQELFSGEYNNIISPSKAKMGTINNAKKKKREESRTKKQMNYTLDIY